MEKKNNNKLGKYNPKNHPLAKINKKNEKNMVNNINTPTIGAQQ